MRLRRLAGAAAFLISVTGIVAQPAASAGTASRAWSGWIGLGDTTVSGVSALAQGGQVDLFYEGTDGRLWEDWENAGSGQWLGSHLVRTDGALAATPLAVSPSPGVVDVFVRGTDDRIWETSYSSGSWSPWSPIGLSFNRTAHAPGGVVQGGQFDLFVTGTDGHLYENVKDLMTGLWTGFFLVNSQGTLAGAPTAVSPSSGSIQVFGPGTDSPHHIYGINYSGTWSPWALIGTPANVTWDDVGATAQGGQVEVFVTGTDDHLWGNTEVGSSWSGFGSTSSRGTLSSGPSAVSGSNGLVQVFGAGTDTPHHIYEISNTGTGVYGSNVTVQSVIANGWAGVGSVSGFCSQPTPTYACPTGSDSTIQQSLAQAGGGVFWLSFWTVGAPVTCDFSANGWYTDGKTAGTTAAHELIGLGGSYLPDYEIIDPEGFGGAPGPNPWSAQCPSSSSTCTASSTATCWQQWFQGWRDGLLGVSARMRPAFYTSQFPIQQYNLLSLGMPAFPAVSPIQGNTPFVTGSNVTGYIAYYAQCPADPYTLQVTNWGAQFNTVQFPDSTVDCPA